eukprot:8967681-Pyramimonas_sp.AAC.1
MVACGVRRTSSARSARSERSTASHGSHRSSRWTRSQETGSSSQLSGRACCSSADDTRRILL